MSEINRRTFLASAAVASTVSSSVKASPSPVVSVETQAFKYCFNTSTIRGQKLDIEKEVDIAAKAGYTGIEPWMRKIEEYQKAGGKLPDLRKRIDDHGLTIESAIGFANWIVDDADQRKKGLEQAKRDMDILAQLGAKRIAAPPAGATKPGPKLDLFEAAKRYRALLELGETMGVVPQVEVWGFSNNLSRLGESMFVAIESGHPQACLLPDVYHIFKGGSDFAGLKQISGASIQVFHMNDYPATPSRKEMNDSHRVYPGDGVAPLDFILQTLQSTNTQTVLSLELFNRDYWGQDALQVAQTGLKKMEAAVAKATGA